MKKVKLLIAVVAVLGFMYSATAHADGFAPGEGLYLGVFGGGGMGIVQPKVITNGGVRHSGTGAVNEHDGHAGGTFEAKDGGLGLAGIEGGSMLGYGYKMGALYAGIEGEWAGGDVKFKLQSQDPITLSGSADDGSLTTLTTIEAEKQWTGGAFGRLGLYINPDTLFAFRGGVLISKFDVKTTGSSAFSEEFYGGGPSFGASLESRIASISPNLSLRMGAVYTDFLTASVFGLGTKNARHTNIATGIRHGHNSEVTGSALSARVGLTYSFFDVNSLF